MARKKQNLEEILTNGKELIKFYREHPCIAAYELLGVDLAPIQRLVFRDMWFKNYVIATCSRGFGKTYLLGVLSALSCLLYPGYRVGLIAPVFRQCVLKNDKYSTFWTDGGLSTGTHCFYDNIVTGSTKIQSLNSKNKILNKWVNEERDCITVYCKKGFEISGTIDHKILVLNSNLDLVYKELQHLVEDDHIAIKTGFNYFGNTSYVDNTYINENLNKYIGDIKLPDKLNENVAYMLGLLCGDGFIENEYVKRRFWIVGYCSEDIELINKYKDILRKEFNITDDRLHETKHGNTYRIEIFSIVLWHYIKMLGMSSTTASDKNIPECIKKSSKANVISFLRGLYDTDGSCEINTTNKNKSCVVSYVSVSKTLCKEIQAVLLNLGILSSFSIKSKATSTYFSNTGKYHKCKECYRLRITGTDNLNLFNTEVNFSLSRKSNLLIDHISGITKEDFNNTVPNSFEFVRELALECYNKGGACTFIDWYLNKYKKFRKTPYSYSRIHDLLVYAKKLNICNSNYKKLENIIHNKLHFVKPEKFKNFKAETIDIEVENEHCYWASGFINHNSKMIFSEVEKLYDASSILREATVKPPIRGSDVCYLKFKSVAGKPGSYIEALPLGADGGKIRGSRFYLIVVDELAQVPDQTLDMVIRPMSATSLAPMEKVRRIEEQRRLIDAGLAEESDFQDEKVNKMVMTSSGYYKFNHMWKRMRDHWRQMDLDTAAGKNSPYAVWQVPYWDLPSGFLDMPNIEEARRIMSRHEFRMEYEGAMVSDSEGFFKASLLEACTLGSGFDMNLTGGRGNYIIGVDPNQGGANSCGVVILEAGRPNKIVNVVELKKHTTQGLTKAIQELSIKYNTVRIYMDKGGGGKAVMDLLEEGYNSAEPILDRTNPDNEQRKGRHILEMVNFNPAWISDANFTTKAMLEDKGILFPELDTAAMDTMVKAYETITTLKSQLLNIIVTQTATGILHFDTPSKDMNKDLYSALILAAHGARMMEKELEEDDGPILYQNSGMIRMRDGSTNFNVFNGGAQQSGNIISAVNLPFGTAILEKRKK